MATQTSPDCVVNQLPSLHNLIPSESDQKMTSQIDINLFQFTFLTEMYLKTCLVNVLVFFLTDIDRQARSIRQKCCCEKWAQ